MVKDLRVLFTCPTVMDAPHGAHGGKSTEERTALLLQTVGFHLKSAQENLDTVITTIRAFTPVYYCFTTDSIQSNFWEI